MEGRRAGPWRTALCATDGGRPPSEANAGVLVRPWKLTTSAPPFQCLQFASHSDGKPNLFGPARRKEGRCTLHGLHFRSSCLHPCEATCSLCMVQPAVRSPNPRAAPRLELVGFTRRASPATAAPWPAARRQQPCRAGCKPAPRIDKGSIPAHGENNRPRRS